MSDRDIPSVPVTTLAGLTSLSDLLSELPVSDSLSNAASFNKSLLFHTLVANESNNLLSVRDESLVKQLVHAIEQTNSDNIELKPQYAIQQHGTNISTYPELLQGIYNFRPTVFNSSQRLQNNPQDQQQQYSLQQNLQKRQSGINVIQQNVASKPQQIQQDQTPGTSNSTLQITVPGHQKNSQSIMQQDIRNVIQQPQIQSSSVINSSNVNLQQHLPQPCVNVETSMRPQRTSTATFSGISQPEEIHVAQEMQFTQAPTSLAQPLSPIMQQGNSHQLHTVGSNIHQMHQTIGSSQQSQMSRDAPIVSFEPTQYQQPPQQIIQGNFQNVLNLQREQKRQLAVQMQQNILKCTPHNNEFLQNHQQIKSPSSESPGQLLIAPETHQQLVISRSTDGSTNLGNSYDVTHSTGIPSTLPITSFDTNTKKQIDIGGGVGVGTSALKSSGKSQVRSSELARKIGLSVSLDQPTSYSGSVLPASDVFTTETRSIDVNDNATTSTIGADTFTIMKADEKRLAAKRKLAVSIEEIPPEQIFSKPKVRRVERIMPSAVPKCTKDEIVRSQTYQQFMRNMEQIIELLDDTETPNFESDEVDENIECISSKMLNTMSNDVAKLKAKHVLDSIPKNKLTLLINYAMRNVYLAKNYSAGPDDEDEIVDDEIMEKILNAIEACLLVCNIYSTAKDLKFLQEDNISLIIKFVQFQFRETLFPSYDPVYTVKSMKKTDNRKKLKGHHNHNRSLQLLYSKAVELMKVFVTLFDKCIFVDTIVLPLSTLAIEPFFVDNIETLQFVCLELVTTIFRKERYEKIRSSILGDILSSIDRLPSSKKNLRPFKLANNSGNIQMVTALVLQLIQCATILPDSLCDNGQSKTKIVAKQIVDLDDDIPGGATKIGRQNHDIVVLKKYDVAISIGGNFLTTFLNKCKTRSNETDFRPLFENFIHDLLATVNKPEWPASELLLSLLGTMLVRYVSDKSIEQSIRLVSLDYLGIVAARLRKDTVESRCKVSIIDSMIKSIKTEQEKEGDLQIKHNKVELDPEEERTEFLQKILLDFLAVNAQEENLIWDYARHFYLTQWYRDLIYQRRRIAEGGKGYASRKKNNTRRKRRKGGSPNSSTSDLSDESEDGTSHVNNRNLNSNSNIGNNRIVDQELNLEIFNMLEERKRYLLNCIKPYSMSGDMNHTSQQIKTYIDYNNAHLIAQYLATKRPFSQSFDGYLKKIILVVNEPSIAVRTRAMKCLANIVEVDPMVLKRKDMQMGVNQKFLDAAISVREAAVDLVGKFVLSNEELIDQYYDMLSTRILDTGVSVRKRVIKILRDICIEYPDFEKNPEICVKMIRRVNDEEGIQKLVTEVFMKMWFTPCQKNDKFGVQRKINQIIDVVNTAHDTGTTWLEGLLNSIFQPKENMLKLDNSSQEPVKKNTEPPPEIVLSCQQLADGLVDRLIELEDTDNARMLGCITTLHLLAKVRPQLLVRHAITIEPYLNIKCHPTTAPKFICAVADILEKVVPLVNNASESFLASLEEHLMLLVVSLNQAVVTSCVSCLGALVNKITKNYKLIRDCFQKFYRILDNSRNQVLQNNQSIDGIYTPMFRRSLFTIGILMRYFDFKSSEVIGDSNGLPPTICDNAFECLMFYVQCPNQEIRRQALIAIGSFCVMNDDYLTRSELKNFYCNLLRSDTSEPNIKTICMRNIWIYLTESEMYMHNKEKEWEKLAKNEDLKEMNDVSSGMSSRIIQLYLQEILDCFLNNNENVRLWAVKVVQIVLRQGLVHPVRMVPYLICLSTDSKLESAHRADALLKDIDKTYAGFVNMKVQFGLQLCFRLQEILQCNNKGKGGNVIRGYVKRDSEPMPSALNDFLYTLLRTTKPQRRALVQTVTKQFDDQKTSLRQMLYIADNLAYFPYVVQDEPLYLIHQIDLLISIAGTNLLTTFKECLKPSENVNDILEDDDDEEDPMVLFKRLPTDTTEIQKCIMSAQACMLLLILKEHLKDMYSLTDGKISRYSPSEQKVYEKAVVRKTVDDFNPKTTIEVIKKQQEQMISHPTEEKKQLTDEEKMDLVVKYLDFKQLMLKLDPDDADSDEETREKSKLNNTTMIMDTTPQLSTNSGNQTLDNTCVSGSGNQSNVSTQSLNTTTNFSSAQKTTTKDIPATPTSRTSKITFAAKPTTAPTTSVTARKQPQRSKRKRRKLISSDEDDDYSDEDYA